MSTQKTKGGQDTVDIGTVWNLLTAIHSVHANDFSFQSLFQILRVRKFTAFWTLIKIRQTPRKIMFYVYEHTTLKIFSLSVVTNKMVATSGYQP